MRILLVILFFASQLVSYANHLLGGELTYTYVSDNAYKINVTIYRDCNDCKLGNDGGGTSTESCSNIKEAYIRTISSSCQNRNVGSISLTKTGFKNITQICDLSASRCGSVGTYPYGMEAHHYEGLVDFDDYKSYTGCGFHIYVVDRERTNSFTTIAQNEASTENYDFYNFLYINPWEENISSPTFKEEPKFIFNANQPVYIGDNVTEISSDSIVYKWGDVLSAHNSPLSYTSNYSKNNFLSTYCPSGNNCSPNPSSYPPHGLYLNSYTGDMVFTPTKSNQISTRVMHVEHWRKTTSSSYKASEIRRDVQVIITSANGNNNPSILTEETYNLCVGQPFETDITATDINPNTSLSSGDSVFFDVDHDIENLSFSTVNLTSAPYAKLHLEYTPSSNDIGIHKVQISATDNHCPAYGKSTKTIFIKVHPQPITSIIINEKFCGNNEIVLSTDRNSTYSLQIENSEKKLYDDSVSSTYIFQHTTVSQLVYTAISTDLYGCKDTISTTRENVGSSNVAKAELKGLTDFCPGDSINVHIEHDLYTVSHEDWSYNNNNSETPAYHGIVTPGLLKFEYQLHHSNLTCNLQDSVEIEVNEGPQISLLEPVSFCFENEYLLSDISVTPAGGIWSINGRDITTSTVPLYSLIPNIDTALAITYAIQDSRFECGASLQIILDIKERPEMKLGDAQVCGDIPFYRLNNSISLPYDHQQANISWEVINEELETVNGQTALNLQKGTNSPYTLIAQNTLKNGCFSIDTALLIVDENLTITYNGKSTICQGDEAIYLPEYFDVSIQGGIWGIKDDYNFFGDSYIPTQCTDFVFQYFYHKNGCHSEIEIPISPVCKPTFGVDFPTEICKDASSITLPADMHWTLNEERTNELDPTSFNEGSIKLIAVKQKSECVFDTSILVNILQPIEFNVTNLSNQLCQGEELDLAWEIPSHGKMKIDFCSSNFDNISEQNITYTPTLCDLNAEEIRASLVSFSEANCPSHYQTITLPYYQAPSLLLTEKISGCEPLTISAPLQSSNGDKLDVTYTLLSERQTFTGNTNIVHASNLSQGLFQLNVLISDKNGCTNKQEVKDFVTVWEKPQAKFNMANDNLLTLSKRQINLYDYSTISQGYLTTSWFYVKQNKAVLFATGSNVSYEMPLDTGNYQIQLVVQSKNDCADTTSEHLRLVPDIIAFIPNAFTPDNKGPQENAAFKVSSDHAASFYIDVFNKWGQKVYHSSNIEEAWDGTYNGQFCQNGVYIYTVQIVDHRGEEYTFEGTVNLIR